MNSKTFSNYLFLLPLAVILVFPIISLLFNLNLGLKLNDNREPIALPEKELLFEKPLEYFKDIELFYNDNLGVRPLLVKTDNLLKYLMGVSNSNRVIIGENGWLFHREYNKLNELFIKPLTENQLKLWGAYFKEKNDWCKENGVKYLVAIVPQKHSIYLDKMPLHLRQYYKKSRLDQLYEYFLDEPDLEFFNLKKILLANKEKGPELYYYRDAHWTQYGAFIGSSYIANHINKNNPSFEKDSITNYKISKKTFIGGLSNFLGGADYLSEPKIDYLPKEEFKYFTVGNVKKNNKISKVIKNNTTYKKDSEILKDALLKEVTPLRGYLSYYENDKKNYPNALVIGDSFVTRTIPFLTRYFNNIIYIVSYDPEWTQMNPNFIKKHDINIVIDIRWALRGLGHKIPKNKNLLDAGSNRMGSVYASDPGCSGCGQPVCKRECTSDTKIVNIDGTSGSAISISLTAGNYVVKPIGTSDGGQYDAWSAWSTGDRWRNLFRISSSELGVVTVNDWTKYPNTLKALANSKITTFSLENDGSVSFFLPDSGYNDNRGGISLLVMK
jgi:hypothetical protein